MKKITFVFTLVILLVSYSCVHKEVPTGSKEQKVPKMTEEIQSVDFFGISLHGKDFTSIVKMMEGKVDALSLYGDVDEERQYCKVLFCGVPCGMNMRWEKQNDEVYITSLNFFTSQTSDKAIEALANGISTYYGEYQQTEQDEMENYFRWEGVLMRPVHSEDGGMTTIFY